MTTGPDTKAAVPRLVEGTELLGRDGEDERYLARRPDGRVVRMPWLLHRVASLLDGSRGLAEVAAVIREEDDAAVTEEEIRVVVARRLVPAGLAVAPPDDAPAPRAGAGRGRRGPRGAAVASLVLAALVLVAGTAAATMLVTGPRAVDVASAAEDTGVGAPPAGPPVVTAPGGVTGPPTLFGRVVEVPDATSAVVDVGGRPVRVDVAGLAPDVPACAAADARAFAQETLGDQEVTVVPDPTLPPGPPDRYRAYLVLGSQLSYTDAALRAGWAKAGEGRYREGFVDGQRDAERARAGQWGPPCRARG